MSAKLAVNGGPKSADDLNIPPWPQNTEKSEEYVEEALKSEKWCRLYEDSWTERFENKFSDYHDAKHGVAVSNGTVAIELALRVCGVEPGDEVLVPSNSFIASASVVPCMGAIPRFVDTNPDTMNIDPQSLEEKITSETVGVIGVHYGGYPLDFDAILPIVEKNNLFLIEDSAHAQGTEWRNEKVGTIGTIGTFSFQGSKALPSGEGGIVLTDDDVLAEKMRLFHNIGRVEGEPGYKHYVLSSNYRLSELQGALLLAQLEKLPEENDRKMKNAKILVEKLEKIDGIKTRKHDDRITARGYYHFAFRYKKEAFNNLSRGKFVRALRAEGIPTDVGYGMPLYKQPAFRKEQVKCLLPPGSEIPTYQNLYLAGAEKTHREIITLPHQLLLAGEEGMGLVSQAVRKIQENSEELV